MTSYRILHVDDEPDICSVVEMALGLDPEISTRSCTSGNEALRMAADWHPDLVLLDVMMPVMDGPTTLAHLHENHATANISIVFMTARAQACELSQYRSLGLVGIITKPFDPVTLAACVRKYMPSRSGGQNKPLGG